ncbi:MAG: hypothetical protein LBC07_03640 [Elusimicrobiota bacterium]|nr:hypothetical protein [Elusimicrobiota bacterium]
MIEQDIENSFTGYKDGLFCFDIKKNFIAFRGHFPQFPILPGIVEVEMIMFCIRKLLNNEQIKLKEIIKIKFIKPIVPDSQILISIEENQNKINAIVKSETEVFAQARLKI